MVSRRHRVFPAHSNRQILLWMFAWSHADLHRPISRRYKPGKLENLTRSTRSRHAHARFRNVLWNKEELIGAKPPVEGQGRRLDPGEASGFGLARNRAAGVRLRLHSSLRS